MRAALTFMAGLASGGVLIGLAAMWLEVPDLWVALTFLAGGLLYYWAVRRAWRLMRFLRRSICRRGADRRRGTDRLELVEAKHMGGFTGIDRRSGYDRRAS